jgi:ketosteroid isomerase-like protein
MINQNRAKGEVMVLKKGLMFALLLCFALVSPCLAKQGDSKLMAEVKTLMEQHDKAFNAQDLKGVMTLYSSDPSIVLMGTGPGEAYVGEEGIAGAYNQFFSRVKADTLSFKYDWIAAGSKGNIAWFAVTITISGTVNNEQKERTFNVSGTLLKEKGKWQILSMHLSRLGAEEQPAAEPPK